MHPQHCRSRNRFPGRALALRRRQTPMEAKMKTLLPALLLIMTLTACETMEGLGRDVENTGETLTQESQEAQVGM